VLRLEAGKESDGAALAEATKDDAVVWNARDNITPLFPAAARALGGILYRKLPTARWLAP